jgi:NAD(P)-dependent dehydrogenase (short-subunit alcohol dehydrogenase family)
MDEAQAAPDGAEVRYDGRVAIVTGAGRGIGRAQALLLGARGAHVVVNDLGGETAGTGASPEPAESVVAEIVAAGGSAVPNGDDVADRAGAARIVAQALETRGRVDILVNNAGIGFNRAFTDVTDAEGERLLSVNLHGALNLIRLLHPRFVQQGYGRTINIISSSMLYGNAGSAFYATAKGGVFGLTRVLALEGAPYNVLSNAVSPVALTRLVGVKEDALSSHTGALAGMRPEFIAPIVGWLAHASCTVNGRVFTAGGGRVAEVFVGETAGLYDPDLSIESVRDGMEVIADRTRYEVPESTAAATVWLKANVGG